MKPIRNQSFRVWLPTEDALYKRTQAEKHPAVVLWDAETDTLGFELEDNLTEQIEEEMRYL